MRASLSAPYYIMPTQTFRYYPGYPYIKYLPQNSIIATSPNLCFCHTAAPYSVVHYSSMSMSWYISPADHTLPTIWNPIPLILRTYTQLSCQHYVFNPLQTQKYHTRFMLRSGTNSAFISSVRYSILPGVVWRGAVHTRFIDRFIMSEGGDPLSLPFTSKTAQSHSVAQNRQMSLFLLY